MKKILLAFVLILILVSIVSAQVGTEILYLEMQELTLTPRDDIATFLRLPVESVEAARALRDQMAATWFVGKQYTAKLHHHIPMGSCTTEDLP